MLLGEIGSNGKTGMRERRMRVAAGIEGRLVPVHRVVKCVYLADIGECYRGDRKQRENRNAGKENGSSVNRASVGSSTSENGNN